MTKKIDFILKEILEKIKPSKKDTEFIEKSLKEFLIKFNKNIKKLKIDAEIFVGGSIAKNTLIKKDYYDIDVFVRFNQKYKNSELSNLLNKLLKNFKGVSCVHGSRDYYRINVSSDIYIELIPVKKIKKPNESENITDLSYSHVKYIKKKIKSKNVLNDIRIAKAFCYANNCYGAESYIRGFSGYSLELLIYYYGSFMKFLKAMTKIKEREIIDIEKDYKNKQQILMDLNSAKLHSPIILIDPTYKQRNALAGLSKETFKKFQKECKKFLKNPSIKSFEIKKTDVEKIKKDANKKNYEFILIESKTDRQKGDIAGSKLLKFYRHFSEEISRYFEIKKQGFNYNGKKSARYFFVVKKRKEIISEGPNIKDKIHVKAFKKMHKNTFIKKNKVYAREKINVNCKEFISKWKNKNKKRLKEMYIITLKIIG